MKPPSLIVLTLAFSGLAASALAAKQPPRETWTVSKSSDPITGDHSCVVAAYDKVRGNSFTRSGYLYPVVENNSRFGLLVGVSSGGKIRLPTGDILWRVDDKPFRELHAADNPLDPARSAIMMPHNTGSAETDKAIAAATLSSLKLANGYASTSTLASGPLAKEVLAELLAGGGLIYRSASASQPFGLPSPNPMQVGQTTSEGVKPIPLDASFRAGLIQCGIIEQ